MAEAEKRWWPMSPAVAGDLEACKPCAGDCMATTVQENSQTQSDVEQPALQSTTGE
jgi:hypothetical protein